MKRWPQFLGATNKILDDQVFLLRQSTFYHQNAIRLGQRDVNGLLLESYQVYMASVSFVLPKTLSGNYVEADISNRAVEVGGEDNNIRRTEDSVFISRPSTPRLSINVNSANLPTSLVAGQTITFEYDISNVGEATLSTNSWTDELYLYPSRDANCDTVLHSGIFLACSGSKQQRVGSRRYYHCLSQCHYPIWDQPAYAFYSYCRCE